MFEFFSLSLGQLALLQANHSEEFADGLCWVYNNQIRRNFRSYLFLSHDFYIKHFFTNHTHIKYHKISLSIKSKSSYYVLSLTVIQVCILFIKFPKMMFIFS